MTEVVIFRIKGEVIEESYSSHTFKTIDELVKFYKSLNNTSIDMVEYFVYNDLLLFHSVLKSKTNTPSNIDLMMVNEINKNDWTKSSLRLVVWNIITKQILEIYKNRKVS